MQVARKYQEQLDRLNGIQRTSASGGGLNSTLTLERAVMKLQYLIDRIKTASYGYAGLFDAIKVDEEALDRLYDFDQGLLSGADRVASLLNELAQSAGEEACISREANALITELEALHSAFSGRQDVILE